MTRDEVISEIHHLESTFKEAIRPLQETAKQAAEQLREAEQALEAAKQKAWAASCRVEGARHSHAARRTGSSRS